jgi:AcrR family transcriptional regulator
MANNGPMGIDTEATAKPAGKPRRRTQAERRAATQNAVLNATIECLVEFGYKDTSTARIAERAGVSRGGQRHHFPTKSGLVIQAISHLGELRAEQLKAEATRLPKGRERVIAALDLLWEARTGPLAHATRELWIAARTDAELRAELLPVEREIIAGILDYARALMGEYAERPGFEARLRIALAAVEGYSEVLVLLTQRDSPTTWEHRRDELAELFWSL